MRSAITTPLSVSAYAARVDSAVRSVGPAVVEGEVQKLRHSGPGNVFFDLTDGRSLLACKVWAQEARRMQHRPKDGDLVLVKVSRPDLWKQAGRLSLVVTDLKLAGDGELLRRRGELLAKLRAEGLCDPLGLRPLPRFPRAVGVISGAGSDGLSDVIRAIHARYPPAHVVTCSALVQGKAAPGQIIEALACLMSHPLVDVILIARGGGSVQDLACFDDEGLCRAISACTKPVVCAIGHTPDDPVCNHVSHAAATPTHAPELVVPSAEGLLSAIAVARQRLGAAPQRIELVKERLGSMERAERAWFAERGRSLDSARQRLAGGFRRLGGEHDHDWGRAVARHLRETRDGVAGAIEGASERLELPRERLSERVGRRVEGAAQQRRLAAMRIEARDFRRHGYVLASGADGRPVPSVEGLTAGARLDLHFRDGRAAAVVDHVKGEHQDAGGHDEPAD